MDFIQNQKINQVTENTLVVGMDIAKRTHYASFVDDRGRSSSKSISCSTISGGLSNTSIIAF